MVRKLLPLLILCACSPVESTPPPSTNQQPTKTDPPKTDTNTPAPSTDDPKPEPETPGVDYLIISANALEASAEKWRDYRVDQGLRVGLLTMKDLAPDGGSKAALVDAIQARIKKEAEKKDAGSPFFVLLLGDADGTKTGDKIVPDGKYQDSMGTVSSDNVYADLDEDDIPDLAIGRVAVSTTADADIVLSKTMDYESNYDAGEWNRRASVFASEAGFSTQIDAVIEGMVFKIVEDLPYDYDFTMTYAKQTSPYVWVPEQFSDKVYERMNEGALLMTYVGHGDTDAFTTLTWSGKSFPILDTAQLTQKLNVQHRAPILSFIACLTGGFAKGDSLSERIVRQPGAPVAVLSSTEVSNPVPNAVFVRELGQAMLGEKKATLGEAFVRAKERLIRQNDALRTEIANTASLMYPVKTQAAMNVSHLHMYTLFGDPALKLPWPAAKVAITAPTNVAKGANLNVTLAFTDLAAGDAVVTLEAKRSTIVGTPAAVPADGSGTRNTVIGQNYALANNKRVVTKNATFSGSALSTALAVPANLASGDYFIKVYAKGGGADAISSKPVHVD